METQTELTSTRDVVVRGALGLSVLASLAAAAGLTLSVRRGRAVLGGELTLST